MNIHTRLERRTQDPTKYLRWSFFKKNSKRLKSLTIFAESFFSHVRQSSEYVSGIC